MACFAIMGVVLQRRDHWLNVYDIGRVYTPVPVLLAVQAMNPASHAPFYNLQDLPDPRPD